MKVLITGGTGFVGAWTAKAVQDQGHDVRFLVRSVERLTASAGSIGVDTDDHVLGGLRIAGGLALIGSVVAEYVAGTGGVGSGLAFTILEAGYRLNIPRMFAALLLIAGAGVVIFMSLSFLSHMLLRKWHESALKREV